MEYKSISEFDLHIFKDYEKRILRNIAVNFITQIPIEDLKKIFDFEVINPKKDSLKDIEKKLVKVYLKNYTSETRF